ncbi:fidgetin-like protein 1 [Microplitis demolitor]|uniref:fidgetin-like protein 1 n=1 Tax=Microplitis demolitor TaxID=69319 RepID=UPI00044000B6|nr:fidgetin-like protein 1 [Microplitis demolitor]
MENSNINSNQNLNDDLLEKNYLAAYQELKFSKSDKNNFDRDRKCLALKYHIAKKSSDELALRLLSHDIDDYISQMATREVLQSPYTKRTKNVSIPSKITTSEILSVIQPLPCQKDPLQSCKSTLPNERDVENIIGYWNGKKESPRRRKVSQVLKNQDSNTSPFQNYSNSGSNFSNQSPSYSNQSQNYPNKGPVQSRSTSFPSQNNQERDLVKRQEKRSQFDNLYKKYNRHNDDEDDLLPSQSSNKDTRKLEPFKSGRQINIQQQKANKSKPQGKTLGGKTSVSKPFVCPLNKRDEEEKVERSDSQEDMDCDDERLKNIDPKMIELIRNEIMDSGALVTWNDVAGLEKAKSIIKEAIVLPMLRPDIFTGLRRPPKGILLFGPPGTGKTLIGKCIASQSKSTFFAISSSSLTSKWVGEGEKMVRALFAVARVYQPSVIFIDEIDSLLSQRSDTEHESSRRIKTEFLIHLDGATTGDDDKILLIGATNRPGELDEAARRRFVKRLYVPLPEFEARKQIVNNLLRNERHHLSEEDVETVAEKADHFSGADMTTLCKEASMGPIRSIPFDMMENIRMEDVRGVTIDDFLEAFKRVRPSVAQDDLVHYVKWDKTYGSGTAE